MGLNELVTSLATRRPRCYLVEAPDGARARRAVEHEVDARGWHLSTSPAAADALVVAGSLPPDLVGAADLLWSQLPGPRSRVVVTDPAAAADALDKVRRHLRDDTAQRQDARERSSDAAAEWLEDDHGDMDHGDMEMAPGGVPLAEGAEDRDGLEMDVLAHPLGPLLDRWPGGLELRVTLHGDVVADAEAHWWGAPQHADGWDAVATTLSLAGDERGARTARGLRAAYDDGFDVDTTEAERLRTRVRRLSRSRVLPARVATTLLALTAPDDVGTASPAVSPVELVKGHDLADVRLLVASHAAVLTRDHGGDDHG